MTTKKEIKVQSLKIPKSILITAKLLEAISSKWTVLFAAKLFTKPIKYKIPKREFEMDKQSIQEKLFVESINKEIIIYKYGTGVPKILLVHGWSGRGTQLVKIADTLVASGYMTISFDAPAHGKSKGNSSIMIEFIASILAIEKQYGPFEFAVGHSLGGMSILNAIREQLPLKKAVIIGSGDIIQDIIDEFLKKLKLNPTLGTKLKEHFEKKYNTKMEYFSSSNAAKEVTIPILIIHDENDIDVNFKAAYQIEKQLKQSQLLITKGLGHRKILGNPEVIQHITHFLTN